MPSYRKKNRSKNSGLRVIVAYVFTKRNNNSSSSSTCRRRLWELQFGHGRLMESTCVFCSSRFCSLSYFASLGYV